MNKQLTYQCSRFSNAIIFTLLSLFITFSDSLLLATESEVRDPRVYFFTDTFGDLPDELADAKAAGKIGLFLFFEMEGCPYCKLMLERIFNQKRVQEWFNDKFLNLAIDIYGDVEIRDFDGVTTPSKFFSEHRKVYLTPTMIFFDLKGKEIYRRTGSLKTPEAFLLLGEYVSGEYYTVMSFKSFAKNHGDQRADDSNSSRAYD